MPSQERIEKAQLNDRLINEYRAANRDNLDRLSHEVPAMNLRYQQTMEQVEEIMRREFS